MLIDFSIENFRSFREKQVFSMEAAPYLRKKENIFKPYIDGDKNPPSLLKVAAIYGPNASGKSNLILALTLISNLIKRQKDQSDEPLPVSPFRFDPKLLNEPSKFEINFISDKKRYKFELSLTSNRIFYECMSIYISSKPEKLYERSFINGTEDYDFKEILEGDTLLHKVWRNLTSPTQLFLAQSAANSNEDLTQLKTPFDWLRLNLIQHPKSLFTLVDALQLVNKELPDICTEKDLASFLTELDIPISEIQFNNNTKITDFKTLIDKQTPRDEVDKFFKQDKLILNHKTMLGNALFSFDEESEGTKNLAGFSLIWQFLNFNSTLAFDEFDSSLHPKIIEKLIAKFIARKADAQLIFTSHNTHLMDSKLLRRDQFWIVERDNNGASRLDSIYDYEGRESEDVEKRYYEGRYRGLPNLRKSN